MSHSIVCLLPDKSRRRQARQEQEHAHHPIVIVRYPCTRLCCVKIGTNLQKSIFLLLRKRTTNNRLLHKADEHVCFLAS